MRLGIKREEGHEHRYVHIIDPSTFRGLLSYYDKEVGSWDWVRTQNVEGVVGQEAMLDFLANNGYIPREVPDQEFRGLYEKLYSRKLPMFREMDDFEPSEMPTIRDIVEQSSKDYVLNVLESLARVRRS